MDVRRIDRAADKIIDVFADLRISEAEMMYVAMAVVIRAQPVDILHRVVEFGEQIKWEINNERKNTQYVQDELFG
jgi:hypothetical protein